MKASPEHTGDALNKKIIMKKTLTILGPEVVILCNMAVEISFEEIAGNPFGEFDLKASKDGLALAYAGIIANNPDVDITANDLMFKASGAELAAVINTITESFIEWNKIPQTLNDEEDEKKNNEESESEKKNV